MTKKTTHNNNIILYLHNAAKREPGPYHFTVPAMQPLTPFHPKHETLDALVLLICNL